MILYIHWNGAFLIFAKEKIFFKENHFFYLIDIQLLINLPRVRAFHIRKRVVFETIKKKFLKKFCSSEKRFYNSHVLESQTNGKQVRRKTNKKIDSKKKDLRNRQTKPPRARNKKPFLWETYFWGLENQKFACSLWSD